MAAEDQSSNYLGENVLLFTGGPQFNSFVVPEVRAAYIEIVPVTYARSGARAAVPAKRVAYFKSSKRPRKLVNPAPVSAPPSSAFAAASERTP
jgi:hypothetical protein